MSQNNTKTAMFSEISKWSQMGSRGLIEYKNIRDECIRKKTEQEGVRNWEK